MDSLLERVQALSLIAILSYSLPVILVSFIRKRESTENWLMVCFAYSLVSEICALTLMYFRFNPNYAVNQYNLLSSFCLFAFFYHAIPGGKSKWAFVIPAAIISVAVCFTFFRYGVDGHISYTMALQSIAIIAYSLIYFYRTMKELPDGEISKQPMFWIISG
ncbi:MAG TPA: hypothetical protein VD927_18340, partial [Chryseosolibacter sp.]|nr:hypothetical protein [Chryseosolibacter sp.]